MTGAGEHGAPPTGRAAGAAARLPWLDALKGTAMLWIIVNHVSEAIWGGPYIANPTSHWPPLADRIAQLAPLSGHGFWDFPLNLLRWIGWTGDQGVQLFLIASGFGLAWGLLAGRGDAPLPYVWFLRRRVARVYPLWWGAHALILVPAFALGWGIFSLSKELLLSLAGLRVTPASFYWAFPAWWFIGLLLQLYAVFPLLWAAQRRWGPGRLLAACCVIGFAARAAALSLAPNVDFWLRGAVFPVRLPEFALGIAVAAWLARDRERTDARLRAPATLALGFGAWLIGMVLSATWFGMTAAVFLLGAGGFVLLHALFGGSAPARAAQGQGAGAAAAAGRRAGLAPLEWVGRHSYSLFLVPHPLIMLLLEEKRPSVLGGLLAVALAVPAALLLERLTDAAQARVTAWRGRFGWAGAGFRVALAGALVVFVVVGAEAAARRFVPQEVSGWGERISLQPDARFGWKLIPDRTTRLRWVSYDYRVTANHLGFPGPEFPVERAPGALRIMTTGDAFTSAEGVDTDKAWPRLLQRDLAARLGGRPVEVLNFAITGYGPNQYTAVVDSFAPVYRPDLIVIGFFCNDFLDVQTTDDEFREGIGFDLPPQQGLASWKRPQHLRRWFKLCVAGPVAELLRHHPDPNGRFLGQLVLLERGQDAITVTGRRLVADRLARIKATADRVGARVALALVPTAAQVCRPGQLAYWPRYVDLADTTRYDLDQPQRLARAIADSLRIDCWDLRPPLRAADDCPCQPRNMHWTEAGHRAVAAFVAERLADGVQARASGGGTGD